MTTSYLINRMSSRVLGMKAPWEMLLDENNLLFPLKYLVAPALSEIIGL